MASNRVEELQDDINELNELINVAKRENVKAQLKQNVEQIKAQIKRLELIGMDGSPIIVKDANLKLAGNDTSYQSFPSYSWDQDRQKITVFLTVKTDENIKEENVITHFEKRSFEIKVHNLEKKNYRFCAKKLHDAIVPEKCSIKVKKKSIHVFLVKKTHVSWENLYYKETVMSKMKTPSMDSQTEPSQMIMDMMKQLYEEGDSEMKRTIAKAWHDASEKRDTLNIPHF